MKFCVCLNISENALGISDDKNIEAREFRRRFLNAAEGKHMPPNCGICYRGIASNLKHIEHH